MLCGCIVTKLKSTFDSLVCEFTAKAGEGGIVSRCRCNIFTIGDGFTGSRFCFGGSSNSISSISSSLKLAHGFSRRPNALAIVWNQVLRDTNLCANEEDLSSIISIDHGLRNSQSSVTIYKDSNGGNNLGK